MLNKDILKKLKLIVFDLDGTLLSDYNEIGQESKRLIGELKKLGVKFTIASGRLHSAIVQHAEMLNLQTPLITLDGSLIRSHPEGKIVFEAFVPEKYVQRAINLADKYLLNVALCHDEAIYYTDHNSVIPQIMDKFGAVYKEVESYKSFMERTLEIVITGDYKDSIKLVKDKFAFPYAFGLSTSYYKSHSNEGIYYLEIRKGGTSKGKGLQRLARSLKINIKETAVTGDWYNDRSLFETGALKIAMANAVPEIRRMADFVTQKTNNEDGVGEFLEKVYNAKTQQNL